ncbi:uncharacterized protein DUF4383 [Prauserella shujinwangii]|uniref:Uncharacterized protein DUF4383 n=1 Tax=Prauserella shujinwangii TaxID=1453103 RepID=A0A2T0LX58_9PSEU|nr:DUF4383 domain-containing protein [Prauserella shujinwangii]PRX48611.1 uncharacterized protein DUF4383 [Prauserella shujinwangii]
MGEPATTYRPRITWLRGLALLIGVGYLALGVAGFVVTGGGGVGSEPSRTAWLFGVSAPLNIVHTAVGLLGVGASRTGSTARLYGWLTFFGFSGLTAYGLVAALTDLPGNLVNVNAPDVWLYACTAVAGLALAFVPARHRDR